MKRLYRDRYTYSKASHMGTREFLGVDIFLVVN
jgi:hypothetical protein